MSSEVAFLEIRVGGQGVTEARNRLKELTEQSERAEKAAQKLAAETERAEARKAKAVSDAAEKADKAATAMAVNYGRAVQRMADDAAKLQAKQEAAESKKAAAAEAAAAKADRAMTAMAVNEGKARERMATDAAKYAAKVEAAVRKQEQTIRETGQKQYAEVKKWLMTEEEALRESYLRRRRIIESQGTGSTKQMDLAAMDYKYQQQLLTLRGSRLDSSKYAGTGPGMKSVSPGIQTASDAVSSLASGGGIQGLTSTLIRFAPAAAAAAVAYGTVTKAVAESSAYKTAILQLSATTDGVENATAAYAALDEMETKIPIGADKLAQSFSRLVNAGLDPSESSLRSLAEIALGTGNSLEDVTDKVANATMGNFRGLRELGIRTEETGNGLQMTFRGVTTSIGNDSKSIQGYLNSLGNTAFAGSIDKKMDGLSGSVFKLKDAWDDMFRDIGNGNIGPLIKGMVDTAKDAVDLLSSALNSNALGDTLAGINIALTEVAGSAHKAAGFVKWLFTGDSSMAKNADETTAALKRQIVEEREGKKKADDFAAALKEANKEIDAQGKVVDKTTDALGRYAKMADGSSTALASFNQSMADANAKFAESEEERRKREAEARKQKEAQEFDSLVNKLRTEEQAIEFSYNERQRLIDKKSAKGSDLNAKLTTANYDQREVELANTKAAKLKEAQEKEIADLEQSLQSKDDIARAAYERQVAMVTKNVDDEIRAEALRTGLLQQEIDRRTVIETQKNAEAQSKASRKNALFTPYMDEVEQIRNNERLKLEEYQRARDEDLVSAQEHALLKANLYKKTEADLAAVDMRNKEAIAGNSAALFGNLASAAKNMGGEQSATYKGLFAMSKAFSIAQATMSIATGTAKALELGWPAGIAAGIQVAAQGAGLLAMITSSNYAGAYDAGGVIPAGRVGLVGERGPELVSGPAMVTGRQDTAQMLRGTTTGASQSSINLRIVNAPDPSAAHRYINSSSGETTLNNWVRKNATTIRQHLGIS